ncbi:hypothetical protein J2S70_000507 [Trueperella bonasi]|uniref:Uncharacterized protein n=1 Tax=Trueperella bonasi TaxID=312286 RepID=A0ABT9NEV4_9ACTO|nr:hypothetical protein [Trueperella bonasi]
MPYTIVAIPLMYRGRLAPRPNLSLGCSEQPEQYDKIRGLPANYLTIWWRITLAYGGFAPPGLSVVSDLVHHFINICRRDL